MRVLVDESIPKQFARDIVGHEAHTVRRMGWHGTRNGDLLQRAVAAGFDAIVTVDRNMAFQQNLVELELGIVVIRTRSNRLEDLRPLAREVAAAVDRIRPGEVVHIGQAPLHGRRSLE